VFTFLADLPPDTLGIEASGAITHEDYQQLTLRAEAMMGKGPIKGLYVLDNDWSEYSPQAFWDDQMFGLKHWHDFSHVAVVSDQAWVRGATRLFAPFFPAKVKVFAQAQLADAKAWLAAPA
jgi:hypothetical protein